MSMNIPFKSQITICEYDKYELYHDKICFLHMQKQRHRSAVFARSIYFLNTKFQAARHLMWLYSPVCVEPGRNHRDRFPHDTAHTLRTCLAPFRFNSILCVYITLTKFTEINYNTQDDKSYQKYQCCYLLSLKNSISITTHTITLPVSI